MWYLVFTRNVQGKEPELKDSVAAHRQWLDDQHRCGRLLFSGPMTDGGGGAYVMLAQSLEEARQLAASDPHHANGSRRMEIFEWRAHRAFRLDGPAIADIEGMARGKNS
jgi:uncharacterized protein YciI